MKFLRSLALAFFCSASLLAADEAGDTLIRKSFQVAPGGKLTIRADRGSIDVTTAAVDKVEIEITREPGRGFKDADLKKHIITFDHQGNDVTVKAEMDKAMKGLFKGGNNLKVKYVVTVPEKYNVDLHSSGGSISVQDLEGDARTGTSGGSLKFGQIKGKVHGRTSGGSIHVNGSTQDVDIETSGGGINVGNTGGNVMAHTSGGSIRIGDVKGSVKAGTSGGGIEVASSTGPVEAHTSGGSIRATITQQPSGPCSFTTSGGGIEVKMATNIAVDLDAHTSGGSVTTDFPVTVQGEMKKNQLRSKLNGGGPKLTLGTSGGSIKIRKI